MLRKIKKIIYIFFQHIILAFKNICKPYKDFLDKL